MDVGHLNQQPLLPVLLLFLTANAMAQQTNAPTELVQAIQSGQMKVMDLTHTLSAQAPYWPEPNSLPSFRVRVTETYARDGYLGREVALPEHFGTHMDAPLHFDSKGKSVDQLSAKNFLAVAVVIDVTSAVRSNADYRLSIRDLERWVKAHGTMPRGCLVLLRTGWAARWPSEKHFMNQDAQGAMHFPGYSVGAARYLLEHVHPVGIGIDTSSIDYGLSKNFPVHHLTMTAGLYHLENLANLDQLPLTGSCVIALPLKLQGGSGSPARVLALVPEGPTAHN